MVRCARFESAYARRSTPDRVSGFYGQLSQTDGFAVDEHAPPVPLRHAFDVHVTFWNPQLF